MSLTNESQKRHVLFDLDGTLVDSRAAVSASYESVFSERLGLEFPPADLVSANVFAMRPREVFERVAPERVDELHEAYRRAYPGEAHRVKCFGGAAELIRDLVGTGRQPSLVTNKGLERTKLDLESASIDQTLFTTIVTAEDTEARKPHPAPILFGMGRAGSRLDEAVYVGDGPQDVEAAHAAGIPAILVTYGFYDAAALADVRAECRVDSIRALREKLGLPAATSEANVP